MSKSILLLKRRILVLGAVAASFVRLLLERNAISITFIQPTYKSEKLRQLNCDFAASSLKLAGRLMDIGIRADKDEILGGPDHIPYLKLELSEDGTAILHAGHRHFDHYRVPMEEWSGRKRIWSASLSPGSYAIADPVMIESLADRLKPLLKRVAAGHSIQWGGPNPIGRLTDDASEASVEIERLLQAERWWDGQREVWDADDWLYELGYDGAAKDYGLSIDSDDAAYKAAGERMKADACQHGVILVNVDALLHRIRRALQADAKVAALAFECHLGESCC